MEGEDDPVEARLEAELDAADEAGSPPLGVLPDSLHGAPHVGDEVGVTSEWAVPWSDLMMVMFILFVVLFSYHTAEREIATAFAPDALPERSAAPESSPPPPFAEATAAEPVFQQSVEAARRAGLEGVEIALDEDRSVRVSLRGAVFFDLGEAQLGPEARSFLDPLAAVLAGTRRPLRVIGHTDSYPIHSEQFPTNWELSAARAAAVARFLIRRGPLDPARFSIVGRSMYEPALPNTTPDNKALNRRVEVVIAAAADETQP
jgi:chemotaxis protein MotB